MYCPKCKKDIKPGSEKQMIHRHWASGLWGAGMVSIFLYPLLFGFNALASVAVGLVLIILGFVIGFILRQTVCPACKKVLLPENPFSEP